MPPSHPVKYQFSLLHPAVSVPKKAWYASKFFIDSGSGNFVSKFEDELGSFEVPHANRKALDFKDLERRFDR